MAQPDLVLRDVAGGDVTLYDMPFATPAAPLVVYLYGPTPYVPSGSGTFPAVGDVDAGVVFGPADNLVGTLVQPAPGDVDAGVGYGASGSEFTGTLVQPAEGDVRSGTLYGADGTEYTGTLIPGGGGGTVIFLQRRSR